MIHCIRLSSSLCSYIIFRIYRVYKKQGPFDRSVCFAFVFFKEIGCLRWAGQKTRRLCDCHMQILKGGDIRFWTRPYNSWCANKLACWLLANLFSWSARNFSIFWQPSDELRKSFTAETFWQPFGSEINSTTTSCWSDTYIKEWHIAAFIKKKKNKDGKFDSVYIYIYRE